MDNAEDVFTHDLLNSSRKAFPKFTWNDVESVPGLKQILGPLKDAYEAYGEHGMEGLIDAIDIMIGEDALERKRTGVRTDKFRFNMLTVLRKL